MSWTAPILDRMKGLNAEGLSRAQIAVILNREFQQSFSRNAVIAKIDRLGWVKPTTVKASAPALLRAPIVKPVAPKNLPQARVPMAAVTVAPLPNGGPPDSIALNPLPLLHPDFDVRRACRWPLRMTTPSGDLLHCCNVRPFGETYCEEHLRWKDPKHRSPEQIRIEADHKARMQKSASRGRTYTSRFDRRMAS